MNEQQKLCPAGFPVPAGTEEWVLVQGPKGEKGERGDKGPSRLPAQQARAVVILVVIAFLINGAGLFWQAHQSSASHTAQQRSGQLLERKLCQTFGELAANRPPAGNPATNPARAYDQRQHDILDQLGTDLGCR